MSNEKKPETPEDKFNAAVREKVLAGLTKDQAIEVIKAQAAHDAELEKAAKKAAPAKT